MPRSTPKPQRTLSPEDAPKASFSGELYDDRAALLNYQKEQAEKGNPQSQYAMGIRYLTGTGVAKDEALARRYLEAASKNGNLQARQKLKDIGKPKKAEEEVELSR